MEMVLVDLKTIDFEEGTKNRAVLELGHYRVICTTVEYKNGDVTEDMMIREDPNVEYLPEIYYEDLWGEEKFEIQTTSYGALSPDEIRKVVAGYQEAMLVVETLQKNFKINVK